MLVRMAPTIAWVWTFVLDNISFIAKYFVMKKLVMVLCLILLPIVLLSQEREIKKDVNTYFELLSEHKVSEALDMVHPELLSMLGKASFQAQYEKMFNNSEVKISFGKFQINSVSDVFAFDEKTYALVDYNFNIIYKVDLSKDDKGTLKALLLSNYQSKFGAENVVLVEPDEYHITTKRELMAVNANSYNTWKVLELDEGIRALAATFIPQEVLSHFSR